MAIERKAEAPRTPIAVLTPDEEVTLRRVAFGQSTVRAMRAEDLARLRKLRLIQDDKDGPCLTVSGRQHFDELPKAMLMDRGSKDLMSAMSKLFKTS
ncbi:hypothetical protein [Reyranella aquatilis]|jgi:hypothetical protein|uniref:Uncharacterized protein n=1 Tax=Reyranella aquatilis TaxID=2035356 RepID=A0ABS8L004_9HYPH|nr:hypothetical protein [Reyranella aquatilis]MCC8431666.1 hypothetical protein [Reyranella aquatilis]